MSDGPRVIPTYLGKTVEVDGRLILCAVGPPTHVFREPVEEVDSITPTEPATPSSESSEDGDYVPACVRDSCADPFGPPLSTVVPTTPVGSLRKGVATESQESSPEKCEICGHELVDPLVFPKKARTE